MKSPGVGQLLGIMFSRAIFSHAMLSICSNIIIYIKINLFNFRYPVLEVQLYPHKLSSHWHGINRIDLKTSSPHSVHLSKCAHFTNRFRQEVDECAYILLAGLDIGYVPAGPHAFFRSSGQFGPQQFILCWPAGPVAFRSVANACTSFFC